MDRYKGNYYATLDIMKFCCSILIVIAHFISENASGRIPFLLEYASSIYIIVVPFFFACSGYLLFEKILLNKNMDAQIIVKEYIIRIIRMYLAWSMIYVFFKVLTWIRFGTTIFQVIHYIINAITYSTYQTIWFLPALCIGVILTFLIYNKFGLKWLVILCVIFYAIGMLGVSYSFVFEGTVIEDIISIYNWLFVTTRNGLFNGFPFVSIGLIIASLRNKKRINLLCISGFTFIFAILFISEAIFIKTFFEAINVNTLFFLLPFTFMFLLLCLCIPLKENKICKWFRKMSTLIFLCQRLYLSAIPDLFPNGYIDRLLKGDPYIGCLKLVILVLITSEIILIFNKKNKLIFC